MEIGLLTLHDCSVTETELMSQLTIGRHDGSYSTFTGTTGYLSFGNVSIGTTNPGAVEVNGTSNFKEQPNFIAKQRSGILIFGGSAKGVDNSTSPTGPLAHQR